MVTRRKTTYREFAKPAEPIAEATDTWRAASSRREKGEGDTDGNDDIPHECHSLLRQRLAAEIILRARHPIVIGLDTMLSEQEAKFSRMPLDMAHVVEL